jgi:hypothetical protein
MKRKPGGMSVCDLDACGSALLGRLMELSDENLGPHAAALFAPRTYLLLEFGGCNVSSAHAEITG